MSRSFFPALAPLAAGLAIACTGPPGAARVPEATLAPLEARVAAARERAFRAPVRALSVPHASVGALLAGELDRVVSPAELAGEEALARALGLLPEGLDLRTAALTFQADSIAGFYSQIDRRLIVVGGAAEPDAEGVLVHELAHALQDQRSDLLELLLGLHGDDDLGFAIGALLEGEATWVELEDVARQSAGQRLAPDVFARQFEAAAADSAAGVPLLMRESVVRAYPLGYALVDALARRSGVAGLDAAYDAPPLSSEELLHPEQFLGPARRVAVARLPRDVASAGCRVAATNSYGELGVQVWLRESGLDPAAASALAAGWDGDRAWAFACGTAERVAWLIQRDDEAAALALELAMRGRLEWRGELVLRVDRAGSRVLVSGGAGAEERARLLALPEAGRAASLAQVLAAQPEIRARARALRR